jgi:aspartate racemase
MKTLGIIGGIGPESTVEYYRTIISLYRERTGDGSYPSILINSIDLKKEIEMVERDDLAGLTLFIAEEVERLARAGAHIALIASNTPHIVFDEVLQGSALPLLSIVEAASAEARRRGLKRAALFGTRFTMTGSFYPKVFSRDGIELVIPDRDDLEFVHDKYMNELVQGTFLPETRSELLQIVERMADEKGADSVLLAGTELPLILKDETHRGIPLIDTMRIHAAAAVSEMLK